MIKIEDLPVFNLPATAGCDSTRENLRSLMALALESLEASTMSQDQWQSLHDTGLASALCLRYGLEKWPAAELYIKNFGSWSEAVKEASGGSVSVGHGRRSNDEIASDVVSLLQSDENRSRDTDWIGSFESTSEIYNRELKSSIEAYREASGEEKRAIADTLHLQFAPLVDGVIEAFGQRFRTICPGYDLNELKAEINTALAEWLTTGTLDSPLRNLRAQAGSKLHASANRALNVLKSERAPGSLGEDAYRNLDWIDQLQRAVDANVDELTIVPREMGRLSSGDFDVEARIIDENYFAERRDALLRALYELPSSTRRLVLEYIGVRGADLPYSLQEIPVPASDSERRLRISMGLRRMNAALRAGGFS